MSTIDDEMERRYGALTPYERRCKLNRTIRDICMWEARQPDQNKASLITHAKGGPREVAWRLYGPPDVN